MSPALQNLKKKAWMVAIGALAAAMLPFQAPAHAGVDVPVSIQVSYAGTRLGGLYGTVNFETTSYTYSLAKCRESSYVPIFIRVYINGALHSTMGDGGSPVSIPQCLYTAYLGFGTVSYGSTIYSVQFVVRAVYFDGRTNTPTTREVAVTYDNPLT